MPFEPHIPATFRIHRFSIITGRGPVVVGELLAGEARAGAWLVPACGPALQIDAVESVTGRDLRLGSVGLVLRGAPAPADVAAQLPVGSTVVLAEPLGTPVAVDVGLACHRGLRRYWFPLSTGLGIGVTAASDAEAAAFAADAQQRTAPAATLLAPIVDVDVRTLDPGHVQANIGPVVMRGVWFPRENL